MLAHPDVCSLMNTKQLHEKKRNDTENVKEEKEKGKKRFHFLLLQAAWNPDLIIKSPTLYH